MTHKTWTVLAAVACVLCILALFPSAAEDADAPEYVCPPCGHDCLKTVFDEAGACGKCGMKLVLLSSIKDRPASPRAAAAGKKVAILIFDGVQIIDYTGPYEIFGQAGYHVFTVAKTPGTIETTFGMKVVPDYTLADHPSPDIVLVPGGQVFATQDDPAVKEWLTGNAEEAEVVLSVCNGAFILAKAGLLRGLKATTTRPLVDGLANAAPHITVVRNVRYVDNGKIVTSGGLSAGMDAALHIVSRINGQDNAGRIARRIEYDWNAED